jgi:hypothetical protein
VTKDPYPYVMEAVASIVLGAAYLFLMLLFGGVAILLTPLVLMESGLRKLWFTTKDALEA